MRCIDADALINLIPVPIYTSPDGQDLVQMSDVMEAIKRVPTINPEQKTGKWIPSSERLPENSNTVLITHRGGVSFGWYNGRYWERGASTNHRPMQTVTAWMPLPGPYKEGGK